MFKIGDEVYLRSGSGDPMTVIGIDGSYYIVVFYLDARRRTASYLASQLTHSKPVVEEEKPRKKQEDTYTPSGFFTDSSYFSSSSSFDSSSSSDCGSSDGGGSGGCD